MLKIAGDFFAGIFDCLGEREAVGKTRKAVPQHLGPQGPLGLKLDGPIDDAEQAATVRPVSLRQGSKLDPIELRRDAVPIGKVELARGIFAAEEVPEQVRYRAVLQAV